LLFSLFFVARADLDNFVLPNGYTVNFDTSKDSFDSEYAVIPVGDLGPTANVTLYCSTYASSVTLQNSIPTFYFSQNSAPTNPTMPPLNYVAKWAATPGNSFTFTAWQAFYYVQHYADCPTDSLDIPSCTNSITVELTCRFLDPLNAYMPVPPQILDQRRTGKIQMSTDPSHGISVAKYWFLAISSDLPNGLLTFYINALLSMQTSSTFRIMISSNAQGWPDTTLNDTQLAPMVIGLFEGTGGSTTESVIITTPGVFFVTLQVTNIKKDLTDSSDYTTVSVKAGYNAPPSNSGNVLKVPVYLLSLLAFVTIFYNH